MQLVLLFVHCVDCVQVLWQVFHGTAGAVGVHGSIDVAALCEALTASKDLQHLLDLGSGVVGTDLQQSFAAAVQQVLARREPPSSWHTFMQVRSAMLLRDPPCGFATLCAALHPFMQLHYCPQSGLFTGSTSCGQSHNHHTSCSIAGLQKLPAHRDSLSASKCPSSAPACRPLVWLSSAP